MRLTKTHVLIVGALASAVFAIVQNTNATPASASESDSTPSLGGSTTTGASTGAAEELPAGFLPALRHDQKATATGGGALPQNHPPVGEHRDHAATVVGSGSDPSSANDFAPADQAPAVLTWKAPSEWQPLPNPSTMRLATNKVPRVAGDNEDAELIVSRAGGEVEANVQRWVGQFGDVVKGNGGGKGKEQIRTKTVQGFKVTLVEIEGTYAGGMGASNATHKGWALIGAIVETPPQSYFFKVIGPAATVKAARKPLEAMIDGITSAR